MTASHSEANTLDETTCVKSVRTSLKDSTGGCELEVSFRTAEDRSRLALESATLRVANRCRAWPEAASGEYKWNKERSATAYVSFETEAAEAAWNEGSVKGRLKFHGAVPVLRDADSTEINLVLANLEVFGFIETNAAVSNTLFKGNADHDGITGATASWFSTQPVDVSANGNVIPDGTTSLLP